MEVRELRATELEARKWRAIVLGVGELGSIEFVARELGVVRWVQESQEQESWE